MSFKLTDYLKLIPKGLSNPDKLIEGWYTELKSEAGFLPEEDTKKIIERRLICESCPYNSENAKTSEEYKELFGKNYESTLDFKHCAICSCPLRGKTSCLSCHCGLDTYNAKNPNNFQNLKW